MFKRPSGLCGVLCVIITLQMAVTSQGDERPIGLVTKQAADGTLDGWEFFCEQAGTNCGDVWQWENGVLICKGTPKGYLYTQKDYADFVMRFEWRWPADKKPGSGGVLIRTTGPAKIWPKSLEAQINAGQAGDFWGLDGFMLEGPAARTKKLTHDQFGQLTNVAKTAEVEKAAGEWNQYEIVAQGETVTLKINGQVVNKATRCDVKPGRICLTAEGDEIHFRKLELVAR